MDYDEGKPAENVVIGTLILLISIAILVYFYLFLGAYLDFTESRTDYFSMQHLVITTLVGFGIGLGINLFLSKTLKKLASGAILLAFPLILLAFLLRWKETPPTTADMESASEIVTWLSLLIGLTLGITSGTWIIEGYQKLRS